MKRTKPFYAAQVEALQKFTTPEEHKSLKLTMCAPEWFHLRHGEYAYDKSVYKNDGMEICAAITNELTPQSDEYFADVAIAYQQEIADLYARGCSMSLPTNFWMSLSNTLNNREYPV